MKNLIRLSVVGAMVAAGGVVHAQSLPSSGSADLWLFVSDQSAGTTFAEDTGISVNTLLSSSNFQSGANLVDVAESQTVTASAALSSYINAASAASQTLDWGVEAVQYPTSTSNGVAKITGNDIGIGSSIDPNAGAGFSGMFLANLENWSGGFNNDVTYLLPSYVANGTSYTFSNGTNLGNVWGASYVTSQGGSTNEYGQGPDEFGNTLGSSATLYGVTGNGNTGTVQSYVLGGANGVELSSIGTLTIGGAAPVPLPPAVWLFGSGLLGLVGVGRRRLSV